MQFLERALAWEAAPGVRPPFGAYRPVGPAWEACRARLFLINPLAHFQFGWQGAQTHPACEVLLANRRDGAAINLAELPDSLEDGYARPFRRLDMAVVPTAQLRLSEIWWAE